MHLHDIVIDTSVCSLQKVVENRTNGIAITRYFIRFLSGSSACTAARIHHLDGNHVVVGLAEPFHLPSGHGANEVARQMRGRSGDRDYEQEIRSFGRQEETMWTDLTRRQNSPEWTHKQSQDESSQLGRAPRPFLVLCSLLAHTNTDNLNHLRNFCLRQWQWRDFRHNRCCSCSARRSSRHRLGRVAVLSSS